MTQQHPSRAASKGQLVAPQPRPLASGQVSFLVPDAKMRPVAAASRGGGTGSAREKLLTVTDEGVATRRRGREGGETRLASDKRQEICHDGRPTLTFDGRRARHVTPAADSSPISRLHEPRSPQDPRAVIASVTGRHNTFATEQGGSA